MVTNPDVTWTQASAAVLSSLELNLGIVCNSMARLKPFIRTHFPQWASSFDASGTPGDYSRSKKNNGPISWRGDKASHSYQLGSIDRAARFERLETKSKDITVTEEYQVDFEGRSSRVVASKDSTESILGSEGREARR